jgi:hypothetical protein
MKKINLEDVRYLQDGELFKVKNDEVNTIGDLLSVSALLKRTKLLPKKAIDVVNDFDWKNRGIDTSEVPTITLVEKTLSMSGVAQTLKNIYDTAERMIDSKFENLSDPYATMYQVEDNGANSNFVYHLPWLLGTGGTIRSIRNNWNDMNGSSASNPSNSGEPSKAEKVAGFIAGVAAGTASPGWGMEPIYTFSKTEQYSITIKFPLYNTVDISSTRRNFDFVNLITFQNLKNRTSMVTYVPPSVYEVTCRDTIGGFYMPIAVVEDLRIESIGTVRKTDEIILGKYLLIPEAYSVTITLRELISQSTNIFEQALGGNKVEVTSVISQSNLRETSNTPTVRTANPNS